MLAKIIEFLFGESVGRRTNVRHVFKYNVSEYEEWCEFRKDQRIKAYVISQHERNVRRYIQGR